MKHALALVLVAACASSSKPVVQPTEPTEDPPPDRSSPPKSAKADCDAAYQKALAQVRANDYGKALVDVEVAIACEPLPYYKTSAFVFACMSGNSQKASLYYASLPPDQQSLRKLCERQKPPVAFDGDADDPPPPPEAPQETIAVPAEGISKNDECTDYARRSLDLGGRGQYAAALAHSEKALECDPLPYYTNLSFMWACKAKHEGKAKALYKRLQKPDKDKFVQICIRENTAYE